MNPEVDTRHTSAVEVAIHALYRSMFPQGDREFVSRVFTWATACFTGTYHDYQPIDARYHDFEHTLQGALCFARLLHGRHCVRATPLLTQKAFELGLLAILLHDTGYLKHRGDDEGTGAKYTLVHVNRSAEFADELLSEKGFAPNEIQAVQNMIRCTGVNVDLTKIPFQNDLEKIVGFALGTSDLLGQMAARDYVDKLPILYSEFEESAQFNAGKGSATGMFKNSRDLMEKTSMFWEKYVLPKLNNDFQGVYRFLCAPYPDGPNSYLQRIERNLAVLRDRLAANK
ncbi:MAG: hypothetical protein JWM68_10 [Verrucomicrobiales bacterium]|nr:hypothetical protein [Verrucomicrobiales bacterium]